MLAVLGALPVFGNTITVTNTNDSGAGSLREAIADAAAGDTINFSVTGPITLTGGEIGISKRLSITGPGANSLAINGNLSGSQTCFCRVISTASGTTVNISGVTIENGSNYNGGGGIFNNGALALTGSTVSGNHAFYGTGIYQYNGGTLMLTNSMVSGQQCRH